MVRQYKTVVFDLDGTLLDTSEGVLAAVKYTIEFFKFPPLSEAHLRHFIGPPIQNSFTRAYNVEGDMLQEIATVFRNRYKDVDLLKATPYPGIYDVFQILVDNDIKPAIATYKRQDYASTILTHFGFDRYTDIMYGADHENKLKKRDIIENALKDSGISNYRDAVMIGDSDNDAIGAEEIEIDFIGVTYGFGFSELRDVEKFNHVGAAEDTWGLIDLLVDGGK